jgi:hypothetical protein
MSTRLQLVVRCLNEAERRQTFWVDREKLWARLVEDCLTIFNRGGAFIALLRCVAP